MNSVRESPKIQCTVLLCPICPQKQFKQETIFSRFLQLDLNADSGVSTAASSSSSSSGAGTSASVSPTPSTPPPLPPSSYASAASSGVENKGEVREVAEAEEEKEKEKEAFLPRRVIIEEERRHLELNVLKVCMINAPFLYVEKGVPYLFFQKRKKGMMTDVPKALPNNILELASFPAARPSVTKVNILFLH